MRVQEAVPTKTKRVRRRVKPVQGGTSRIRYERRVSLARRGSTKMWIPVDRVRPEPLRMKDGQSVSNALRGNINPKEGKAVV